MGRRICLKYTRDPCRIGKEGSMRSRSKVIRLPEGTQSQRECILAIQSVFCDSLKRDLAYLVTPSWRRCASNQVIVVLWPERIVVDGEQ